MKNIFSKIFNFLTHLFLSIVSLFRREKDEKVKETKTPEATIKPEKKNSNVTRASTTPLPDEPSSKVDPHDETDEGDIESTRIINLSHFLDLDDKIQIIKNDSPFTLELIDELIDKELEEVYKEENFKVDKVDDRKTEKKIEKLKEEIVPKLEEKIESKKITTMKELEKEITDLVAEELEKEPIIPKVEIKPIEEPKPVQTFKFFNVEPPKVEEQAIEPKKTPSKGINKKQQEQISKKEKAVLEAQEELEMPKPKLKDEVINIAAGTLLTTAAIAREFIPTKEDKKEPKEVKKEEPKKVEVPPIELPKEEKVIEVKEETVAPSPVVKTELEKEQEPLDFSNTIVIEIPKELVEEKKGIEVQEPSPEELPEEEEKKEEPKPIEKKEEVRESTITDITDKADTAIEDTKKELAKEDFFEKDYDRIEKQINRMLDDISNTYIRYEGKLSDKQIAKLKKEEASLRKTKDHIDEVKTKDIENEKKQLEADITQTELDGLQDELQKMHLEYQVDYNNELLKKMDKLDSKTQQEIANVDKRMLMNRFNRISLLLEMSSILAFPFIRNKYFGYFTLGLIIDNHFNFMHSWLTRKVNKYQPANLEEIRKGRDALDGAIDLTYKDIVELDYIEEEVLSKYPEMAKDEKYVKTVTKLRTKLTNNYNKLMHKKEVMELHMTKTKRQHRLIYRKAA